MARRIPLETLGIAELKKILDNVFSRWVRLSWANNDGFCNCITCPKKLFWLHIQNGHYISRVCTILRYEPDNCRPQCSGCNYAQSMNRGSRCKQIDFEEALKDDIGFDRVEEMKKMRKVTADFDQAWYIERIEHYEKEVKILLERIPEKSYAD